MKKMNERILIASGVTAVALALLDTETGATFELRVRG